MSYFPAGTIAIAALASPCSEGLAPNIHVLYFWINSTSATTVCAGPATSSSFHKEVLRDTIRTE